MEAPWPTQFTVISGAFLAFLFLKCLIRVFLAVVQAHYFLSTLHFVKDYSLSLCNSPPCMMSWTNNLNLDVYLVSDLLEIYNDLWSFLFSPVIFLLEIGHNTQTDTSAVLTVGEQFYVTSKCLPYFCVLVFLGCFFATVYCKMHHNTIAFLVLNLSNVTAPRSTSPELLAVIPSCLLQYSFLQLVILI